MKEPDRDDPARREVDIAQPHLYLHPESDEEDIRANLSPTPGQQGVLTAAVIIGILLMGIQLWLLTVALDLFLGNHNNPIWPLPLVSGLIFLGGLLTLRLLKRRRRPLS
ncbi:MAG: hypothetical protein BGO39_01325 [Chloroflexi bacterium 54-19]|nr:MAG: hypothetical protein BGO39_01325 [Chloroflexi bacterium 54-19]